MKKLIYPLILMLMFVNVHAFVYLEEFNTLPLDSTYWTFNNASPDCGIGLDNGAILFNFTNITTTAPLCYYRFKTFINMSEDVTVTFDIKTRGNQADNASCEKYDKGGVAITDADDYESSATNCGLAFYATQTNPDDRYRKIYTNPTLNDVTNPILKLNNSFNELKMVWDASEKNISYYYNDVLQNTVYLSNHALCTNQSNITVLFGAEDASTCWDSVLWIDNLKIEAVQADWHGCDYPCIFNDTFDYDDSICLHDWYTGQDGECNLINEPVNGDYICNDSYVIIAHNTPIIFADDGQVTLDFDLNIKSNYELFVTVGSFQSDRLAVMHFEDGSIKTLDQISISSFGSYEYNKSYNYKIVVNIEAQTFNIYQNNTLLQSYLKFPYYVDNIAYIWIQPDVTQGSPYCDFELEQIQAYYSGALTLSYDSLDNESWMYGDYLNLNPANASFDWDSCRAGENPTTCFFRANFQSLMSSFTNFFFDNFVLFLMLIIIIFVFVMLKVSSKK